MLPSRDPDIAALLATHRAVIAGIQDAPVKAFFARCHEALDTPGVTNRAVRPRQVPGCRHIAAALAVTATASPVMADLANSFERLAPRLDWRRRDAPEPHNPRFHDGHANAAVIGHDGLEVHPDVRLGVSLIAPGIDYPDHRHPPEEGYLVMSGGAWRQNQGPWFDRWPGDTVHNVANIWHAMKAGAHPLLALWMLWLRDLP